MSIGPIVTARDVRRAVVTTLQSWLPSTLREAARQAGIDPVADPAALPTIKSWHRLPDFEALRENELPAVVVTSPGLAGPPEQDGDGLLRASWAITVTIVIRGATYDETADRVGLYTGALRTCLVQHSSLDGFASGVVWTGEAYDALDSTAARTIGAGFADFIVAVDSVVDAHAGLLTVPADPDVLPDGPDATEFLVIEHPQE